MHGSLDVSWVLVVTTPLREGQWCPGGLQVTPGIQWTLCLGPSRVCGQVGSPLVTNHRQEGQFFLGGCVESWVDMLGVQLSLDLPDGFCQLLDLSLHCVYPISDTNVANLASG